MEGKRGEDVGEDGAEGEGERKAWLTPRELKYTKTVTPLTVIPGAPLDKPWAQH